MKISGILIRDSHLCFGVDLECELLQAGAPIYRENFTRLLRTSL